MATKDEFGKFFVRLGIAIPRFAPNTGDKNFLDAWFAQLGHLDADTLGALYNRAVAKFDQFPSIRELLDLAGLTQASDEDKGREVGERIFTAIGKFGTLTGPDTAKWAKISAYLGEIGVRVVTMQGGWNQLCEMVDYDNAPILKAQWRELGELLVRKSRSGDLISPPTFDRLPASAQRAIAQLSDKFSISKH